MPATRANPWAVLLVLCLGFFMTLLDLTIVNLAVPSMVDDLGATLGEILWVLNGYTLCLAVLIITAGRLGDLRGPRAMFIAGIAVFTVASALCGLAANPGQLIAARVLQGIGAAVLLPQTLTIVTNVFPPERRGTAFGVWGIVSGLAAVAGPTLGGVLVSSLGWRWIFFVNLPIGVLVVIMAVLVIPDQRPGGSAQRLDPASTLIASVALLAVTFGLIEGERYRWGQVWGFVTIPGLIVAGVLLFGVFLLVQARRQDRTPLVPFTLFADRNYGLMNGVAAAVGFTIVGLYLITAVYLQNVVGLSAIGAGLVLMPGSVLAMVAAPVAGRLADRTGGRAVLITGLTLYGLGLLMFTVTAGAGQGWPAVLPGLMLAGLGLGCTFAPMGAIAMRSVPLQVSGAASGLFNTNRQLGAVIGAAVTGAILQGRLGAGQGFADAMRPAMAVSIVLIGLAALVVVRVRSRAQAGALA